MIIKLWARLLMFIHQPGCEDKCLQSLSAELLSCSLLAREGSVWCLTSVVFTQIGQTVTSQPPHNAAASTNCDQIRPRSPWMEYGMLNPSHLRPFYCSLKNNTFLRDIPSIIITSYLWHVWLTETRVADRDTCDVLSWCWWGAVWPNL